MIPKNLIWGQFAMAMVEDFTVALGQTAQGCLTARVSQNTIVMGTSDESLVSFNSVAGMVGSCIFMPSS